MNIVNKVLGDLQIKQFNCHYNIVEYQLEQRFI